MLDSSQVLRILEEENKKVNERNNNLNVINKSDNFLDLTIDDKPIQKEIKTDISDEFSIQIFEERMRSKLLEDFKKSQSYSRPYYSVTEIIYCLRKAYFSRLKYEPDIENMFKFSYLYLINNVGNEVHKCIQEIYSLYECEKTIINEKYKVKGRIDGLISPHCLAEIKTIDNDKIDNDIPIGHIKQCQIYCYILNNDYNYDINKFNLIYVSRSLKKLRVVSMKYNEQEALSLLERAKVLHSAIQSTSGIPEKYCLFDDCLFCSYKKYCKDQYVSPNMINDFQNYSEPIFLI